MKYISVKQGTGQWIFFSYDTLKSFIVLVHKLVSLKKKSLPQNYGSWIIISAYGISDAHGFILPFRNGLLLHVMLRHIILLTTMTSSSSPNLSYDHDEKW